MVKIIFVEQQKDTADVGSNDNFSETIHFLFLRMKWALSHFHSTHLPFLSNLLRVQFNQFRKLIDIKKVFAACDYTTRTCASKGVMIGTIFVVLS